MPSGVWLTAVAWSLLLTSVMAANRYVPMHKRNSFDPLLDDFTYLGMLAKRDVCSDAFGEEAEKATCVPSQTLCCIRRNQPFPSCQQYLGKGWCCVAESDKDSCYVDQPSACEEENAVECVNLAAGVKRACCPRFTTCDRVLKASESYVRCNINKGDLKSFHAASIASKETTSTTSSSTSTSTSSPTSTETSETTTTTTTTTSNRSSPSTDVIEGTKKNEGSDGLSGGTIAGIAVGAVAGVALLGGLLWFLMRRRNRAGSQAGQQDPRLTIPQFYENQQMKQQQQHECPPGHFGQGYPGGYMQNNGYHQGYGSPPPQEPSELPDRSHHVAEMDGSANTQR